MKNYLLLFALILSYMSFGQEKYTTYVSGEMEHEVRIFINNNNNKSSLYFDTVYDGKVGLIFDKDEKIELFVKFLNDSYAKYKEWAIVAKENQVTDIRKDILELTNLEAYFKGGKWYFNNNAKVQTIFKVKEDGTTLFMIYTPKMKSATNQYIESKSGLVVVDNDEDFNSIISSLNIEAKNKFVESKLKAVDLFKN